MNVWLDDLREPPKGWAWCKNVPQLIAMLKAYGSLIEHVSLDNDLGEGEQEGRKAVLWMAENNCWPRIVDVHSANPVAREYMLGMIERYKN